MISRLDWRHGFHNFNRFQTHRDRLANKPDDVLLVVHAIWVAEDVSVLVAADAVLVN